MTLKVIGAGFGRTGTSSLKQALEELGFGPCHHMTEALAHPEHIARWADAFDGQPVAWDVIFQNYQAAVDWPAAAFYNQLMERYPDARVILTVRDATRWYDSARDTIYAISMLSESPPASWVLPWIAPRQHRLTTAISRAVWHEMFSGRFNERQHALDVFTRHTAEVEHRVPADRLLIYDVKQGWEPRCAFLGVPVPEDKPFPHVNDTAHFRRLILGVRAIAYGVPTLVAVLALVAATLVIRRIHVSHT